MNDRSVKGVYWGRLKPPHKGHLEMIRRFRRQCALTVAMGSAERSHEKTNPFGGRERRAMTESYPRESGIHDVRVVALWDGASLSGAIDNLMRKCRPDLRFLSTERGRLAGLVPRRVRVIRFPRKGGYSSTPIRDSIARSESSWVRLTGRSVVH